MKVNTMRSRGPSPVASGLGSLNNGGYSMGSRINLRRSIDSAGSLQGRDDCKDSAASNTCEKPVGSSALTIPIVLGIVIPVVAAIIVLLYLHRRNVRRLRLEEINDPNKGLDFGLDDAPMKKSKRMSLMFGGEKSVHKAAQLSMDMNLSSPYLLPPGAQGSHDSIHSLARTLHTEADPYRHIAQYANSETGSIRSFNPKSEGSPYGAGRLKMPPRTNSMPRSPTSLRTPVSPDDKIDPFGTPTAPKPTHQFPHTGQIHDSDLPVQPIVPEIDSVRPRDTFNADEFEMPDIPPPPVAALKDGQNGAQSPPNDRINPNHPSSQRTSGTSHHDKSGANEQEPAGLGLDLDIPRILSPGPLPHELENGPLYDQHGNQPQIQTTQHYDNAPNERGRPAQRQPPAGGPQQRSLGVPQQGNKRLSVGFRPLPPNEVMESEDPEFRANRIRSFYKEYFDDSKEAPPPMPTKPRQPQQKQQQNGTPNYYEDYDDSYLGEAAAYYDAETNAFIMPYAQPVTRRAMTPPPAGRIRDGPALPGPRGGPRGPHGPRGSVGGMSLPGGPRRPRAGSALGPRPGSSASGAWARAPPKKNLPPPAPLNTLPTPSKLKDDSFAILNAIDFAPPTTFREHVAGRSQSPMGERRPYQPSVPAATPLATAFDELAVLPSPHMLRKSTTFTNLDFAPPKKFKDAESNMSDAGSIRSNQSGISAAQLTALRGGAGRVSRLPGDTVFTTAAMDNQLKPQWGMRP